MLYWTEHQTALVGPLTLASDGEALTGCWFENDRHFGSGLAGPVERNDDLPVFDVARAWLDRYDAGEAPDPHELPLAAHATPFQELVRTALLGIPYGQLTTYGNIARCLEEQTGRRVSARAVGGAVGRNPLVVIVPCHRVVGADGSLTGFGGGMRKKLALLSHEGVDVSKLHVPMRGTALEGVESAARAWVQARRS